MRAIYDMTVDTEHGGWMVIDLITGDIARFDGRLLTGLAFHEAQAMVVRLNRREGTPPANLW